MSGADEPLAVSSSAIARASGKDRASRSSLVTTRVSPARQAAKASRSPGAAGVPDKQRAHGARPELGPARRRKRISPNF